MRCLIRVNCLCIQTISRKCLIFRMENTWIKIVPSASDGAKMHTNKLILRARNILVLVLWAETGQWPFLLFWLYPVILISVFEPGFWWKKSVTSWINRNHPWRAQSLIICYSDIKSISEWSIWLFDLIIWSG